MLPKKLTSFLNWRWGILFVGWSSLVVASPPTDANLYDSLQQKLKSLSAKETDLAEREQSLRERESLLVQEVDQYGRVLRDMKKRVSEMEQICGQKADALKKVYEVMDPKNAAKILNEMEPRFVGQLLTNMRKDRAAEILAKMNPMKARVVTERLFYSSK